MATKRLRSREPARGFGEMTQEDWDRIHGSQLLAEEEAQWAQWAQYAARKRKVT